MISKENPIVEFFSSVRLAILIISLLVVTSIIGTILPQEQPLGFYIEKYGQTNAIIMEILGFSNTYASMWFKTLLFVLCLNLVVCSLVRVPQVLKFIKNDNLSADITKIKRSKDKFLFASNEDKQTAENEIRSVLKKNNWKIRSKQNADFLLLFAEKSAWSRLGAYFVHVSILIIFLGALIGSIFGFKAFVMLPEGESTADVYLQNDEQSKIPLPFKLRCDSFDIEYYENSMPKEYRSELVVLEENKEVVKRQITVNDPLSYAGLTFYQSSYEPMSDQYTVELTKKTSSKEDNKTRMARQKLYVEPREKMEWKDKKVSFEVVETGVDGHGHGPYTLWFDDELGEPVRLIAEDKKHVTINRGDISYTLMIKQRYATGLQVVKDPGVWLVYIGFGLMLFGLYVAFFMSHRRLWISVQETGSTLTIILSGSSNKNQAGFLKTLEDIAADLLNEKSLGLRRI
ncbi:MAG: cytochrome c biogenesis protein ResB [Desulfobulbaceae bacterium]|nr:MAG: cytochrome c biogenesis protein ResB [Desulfobulbaceae bacterium]